MSRQPTTQPTRALIGAALFGAGRPVTLRELAKVLERSETATLQALGEFERTLKQHTFGVTLESVAGGYRLIVAPDLAPHLSGLLAPPALPSLSQAALEVLAIIAYRQPLTRAEIEAMRGASASTVVTLQERELIKVVGRSPALGQPLLYGTTEKFLLEFGLSSLEELPPLKDEQFAHLLRS